MKYILIVLLAISIQSNAQTGIIAAISRPGTTPTPPTPTPSETGIHVSKSGSDGNACDFDHPCLTIQRGSNVASSGDTIFIHTGTYRETITPATNGQTFMNYSSDVVTISGLELVGNTGWTVHSGNVWKKSISLGALFTEYMTGFSNENFQYNNTEMLSQQIFKNSVAQPLAGYPKVSAVEQYLNRNAFRSTVNAGNFGPTQITDAGLSSFGSLIGSRVCIQGWFGYVTRTVTGHSGSTIIYPSYDPEKIASKFYRVTGDLDLLTQAGEWHYESNTLYYWQSGGGSPTDLEAKARNWAFDLRTRSSTKIIGLNFIGCEPIMTTTTSTNTVVKNNVAKYTSHHLLESKSGFQNGYQDSNVQTGMKVFGSGSVVEDNEFQYASGVTIWAGSNVTIRNNNFEDGGYGGFYPGFIKLHFSGTTGASGVVIEYNTFARSGRGAIELTANQNRCTFANLTIRYNDFSQYNKINVDGAAIYASRKTILTNGMIHHNYFRMNGFDEGGTGQQKGIQASCYWDQASGPAVICYNIFDLAANASGRTGAYVGDFYTQSWWIEENANPDLRYAEGLNYIYNNTFTTPSTGASYSYVTYQNVLNDVQRNNIYRATNVINWGFPGNISNSITSSTNPLFTGVGTGISKFQLQSSSPARGAGTLSVPGLPVGAPMPNTDCGALPYGTAPFRVGYVDTP